MTAYDRWLLQGEPGDQDYEGDGPPCEMCETEMTPDDFGEEWVCLECEPRVSVDLSPVRASFLIHGDGRVSEVRL